MFSRDQNPINDFKWLREIGRAGRGGRDDFFVRDRKKKSIDWSRRSRFPMPM
jgi:hypothetical protein